MNNLSWLLYWAGVSGSISTAIVTVSVFAGIGFIFWQMSYAMDDCDTAPGWRWWLPIAGLFIASFLPSQSTLYAIAASEMGEKVLKTDTATKAEKALNAWLDRQIAPETK